MDGSFLDTQPRDRGVKLSQLTHSRQQIEILCLTFFLIRAVVAMERSVYSIALSEASITYSMRLQRQLQRH